MSLPREHMRGLRGHYTALITASRSRSDVPIRIKRTTPLCGDKFCIGVMFHLDVQPHSAYISLALRPRRYYQENVEAA